MAGKTLKQRTAVPPPVSAEVASLLDSLADAVILVDYSDLIVFFNDQAEKFTALSRNLVLGHDYRNVLETNAWLVKLINRTLDTGQICTDRSATLVYGPDLAGRHGEVPVAVTVTPWRDSEGKDRGVLALLSDRSRLAALEHDLLRSDRLASLGTIAAGLAHEIKNPLGGIKGAAQLLSRGEMDGKSRELVEVIVKETERVNAILETLLGFGRPPSKVTEEVNLHQVLNEVIKLVQLSPRGNDKIFIESYDPSLPPIRGSTTGLKQVFLNLIQNAAEASQPGGTIEVATRFASHITLRDEPTGQTRSFIQISVKDSGAGIAPEDLSRLFTPFFTTKDQGTGLGLVVSHQIIKEHNGFITVESSPNQGTTFVVHLPRGGNS